jgi:hypothetical protein
MRVKSSSSSSALCWTYPIQNQELERVETLKGAWQGEIPLGGKQLLHQSEGGGEEHGVSARHQRVSRTLDHEAS